MQKKTKINIAGTEYKISTDRDILYVKNIVKEINEKIMWYMNKNKELTINHVFILLLLEYIDIYKETKKSEDNLRDQINKYIQEFTDSKKEIDLLKLKIENLENNKTKTLKTKKSSM